MIGAHQPASGTWPLALAPTEPAPTKVTIAWGNPAHPGGRVQVSWDETGDVRNRIDVVRADGRPSGERSIYLEAGLPNRVALENDLFDADYRVEVRSVDAEGNVLSRPGRSPEFDTDRTVCGMITRLEPRADGSIRGAAELVRTVTGPIELGPRGGRGLLRALDELGVGTLPRGPGPRLLR